MKIHNSQIQSVNATPLPGGALAISAPLFLWEWEFYKIDIPGIVRPSAISKTQVTTSSSTFPPKEKKMNQDLIKEFCASKSNVHVW